MNFEFSIPKGGTVIVVCLKCERFTWDTSGESLRLAGWFDAETEHVACPVCGIGYVVGWLVGKVNDPAGLEESLRRQIEQKNLEIQRVKFRIGPLEGI